VCKGGVGGKGGCFVLLRLKHNILEIYFFWWSNEKLSPHIPPLPPFYPRSPATASRGDGKRSQEHGRAAIAEGT